MVEIKGYKVFNPDWTCRDKQYACPGIFEEDVNPDVCNCGMHFCKNAADCFNYYSFDSENKVAEVVALGDVMEDGDKCATNKLQIVREVPWAELLSIINTGKDCTGRCNTGDWNTGDCNTGDWNTGDWNKACFSNGCFNTEEPKIYLFNKPSEWTYRDWLNSRARCLMRQINCNILDWIRLGDMTEDEKTAHPKAEITGGYLKPLDNSESAQIWWQKLSDEERGVIKSIPNFDKDVFKEIVGIDVDE